MEQRKVYVCRSGDCRDDRSARLDRLLASDDVEAIEVRCQKLCDGPVVGCAINGRLEWFDRVRGQKLVAAVDELLRTGRAPKILGKRRSKKRSGRLRT